MKIVRVALGHYRELILAGTFAAMATWEVLEMALLEPAPRASISLALVVHSLQIALILTATAIALRAWREKTARERALASLVEQVIVAQEEERRRVAYDVHDGVAQLIVSAKQHIDTAADLWTTDPGRAASETVIAADRLGRAITETRRILAALRPLAVDAAGLAEAARQSLDEVARDTGWSVALVENLGEANLLRANTHSFTATTSAGGTVQLSHETTALGRANRPRQGQLESLVRDNQNSIGVYLQDTFDIARNVLQTGDRLIVTAAVRWDWLRHDLDDRGPPSNRPRATGVSTFSRPNPAIGFNYNLSRDSGIFFGYSEGFRAPAFLELTCAGPSAICPGLQAGVAPDPPLNAVTARNYELGSGPGRRRGSTASWPSSAPTFPTTSSPCHQPARQASSSRTWAARDGRAWRSRWPAALQQASKPGSATPTPRQRSATISSWPHRD